MGDGAAKRKRVKGSDMGDGAAKRKRVKGSDLARKRKRYLSSSSSRPVKSEGCAANSPVKSEGSAANSPVKSKRSSASDSDVAIGGIEMKGLSSSDSDVAIGGIEMKGWSSSDSEVAVGAIEMKGWSSSDSEVAVGAIDMKGLSSSDSEVAVGAIDLKGLSSSDSEVAVGAIDMKGWTSSDGESADVSSPSIKMKGCSTGDTAEVLPHRKRVDYVGCSANDAEQPGVSEDLDKVQYFGTTASGGDEQALQRTKNLSHSAFPDMKQSGFQEFDVKNLAEIFELRGNEAMESKLYPVAIEFYNVAIAFGGDNAIYYCNRAAAYIQTCRYAEAILDCQKSIAIDPNYIKAYTRLGYIYFVQGIGALEKGYRIATLLHPSVRESVRAAEHKIWQQREESGQTSNWSYLNGVIGVRDQVPSPLFGNNSGTRLRASAMDPSDTNSGELYAAIRADISFLAALRLKANNSNEN